MRRLLRGVVGTLLLALLTSGRPAAADDIVVKRHVVLREGPSRSSAALSYPEVGSRLQLLDDGESRNGYLHTRAPDGRTGWIYRTFVSRVPQVAERLIASQSRMKVHVIDVDQGNAMVVEFPCAAVAIDLGGRGEPASLHLLAYLKRFFQDRPDLRRRFETVAITHTHVDHNVNLRRAIDGRYAVGSYLHNGRLNGSGRLDAKWWAAYVTAPGSTIRPDDVLEAEVEAAGQDGLTDADTIDRVDCGSVDPRVRILSGGRTVKPADWTEDDFEEGNNHSLVIRIDFGEASVLFTGDLEEAGMRDLVRRYAGTSLLDADVLMVSHHGAGNGTPIAFLEAVSPEVAVMSVGPESIHDPRTAYAHGHPRSATVAKLVAAVSGARPVKTVQVADGQRRFRGIAMSKAVYATGWDGDVVISAEPDGRLQMSTSR